MDIFKNALLLMDALFNDHEMSTCCFLQAERGAASAKSPLSPRRVKLLEGKIKYTYAHIQNQTYIMYTDRTFVHLDSRRTQSMAHKSGTNAIKSVETKRRSCRPLKVKLSTVELRTM